MPPGLEASQQHSSTMDYLFGIVVLLCGAVQPGRGVEPKHNVPRLKLSYKGKPILSSPPPAPGYLGPRRSPVLSAQTGCISLFHAFLFIYFLLMLSISFFPPLFLCVYFRRRVSLIYSSSSLVSAQNPTLSLSSIYPPLVHSHQYLSLSILPGQIGSIC